VAAGIWDVSGAGSEVAHLYDTAFGRLPDVGGFTSWVAALNSGASLQALAGAFVTSAEFTNTYGALDNAGFVQALYGNTLHRAGDAAGVAGWTGALAQGATRAQVVVGFSESAEHKANTAPNIMSNDPSQYGIRMTWGARRPVASCWRLQCPGPQTRNRLLEGHSAGRHAGNAMSAGSAGTAAWTSASLGCAPPIWPAAYPARRVARMLTTDMAPLAEPDRAYVERLLALSPALATVRDPTQRFGAMVRTRPWMRSPPGWPMQRGATHAASPPACARTSRPSVRPCCCPGAAARSRGRSAG